MKPSKKVTIAEEVAPQLSKAAMLEAHKYPQRDSTYLNVGPAKTGLRHRLSLPQEPPKPSPSEMSEMEAEEEEEEEGREEMIEEGLHWRRFLYFHWLLAGLRWVFPGTTPFLMLLGFLLVMIGLSIRRISEGLVPPFEAYALYLFTTAGLLLGWMILRAIWMLVLYYNILPENRYMLAINAVLDPYLTYIAGSITVCLFWAYVPVTHQLAHVFKIDSLRAGGIDDLLMLLKANLYMILWALRVRYHQR